jgi:phosphomevalonate kinase
MIARAPGKLVLSGAYAVLEGAPALVTAVDRYVVADARRDPARVVPEVAEALRRRAEDARSGSGRGASAPWFDASALRDDKHDRKLGLGSSSAILVASLAALELADHHPLDDQELAARVFLPALGAHRAAQGGGSGIDVAASTFGGTLLFQRETPEPRAGSGSAKEAAWMEIEPKISPFELPNPLFIEVWASARPVPTADMLAKVAAFREARPSTHRTVMRQLTTAAEMARRAAHGAAFVEACRAQLEGLTELGALAGAPIVTPDVQMLDASLRGAHAVALPSGAGGGDIVLLVSAAPLAEKVARLAREIGLAPLPVALGARGVHQVGSALPLQDEVDA